MVRAGTLHASVVHLAMKAALAEAAEDSAADAGAVLVVDSAADAGAGAADVVVCICQ